MSKRRLPYTLEMRRAVLECRRKQVNLINSMPDMARTQRQAELQAKHGSPRAFAEAVVKAIGEFSVDEANAAIRKYRKEWEAAA